MRNISFSLTERQFLDGSKDVTRRLGWAWLTPGTELRAVRKAMGLKKGERVEPLGVILVVRATRERLYKIDQGEVCREGFPGMTPDEFVAMFCQHMGCRPEEWVTRIEFRRVG